jgi:glyceraldehyde 3-phosphate dehydrogenase
MPRGLCASLCEGHLQVLIGSEGKNIGKMVKVVAWYDNEVGISNRIAELVSKL